MQSGDAHDLSPGLLRQRRNLMVSSIGLLFLDFSEAKLEAIQVLGVQATFGRPEAIVIALLAATGYFGYRYWLYLVQEPSAGLRGEYFERLNRYAERKLLQERDSIYPAARGLGLEERLGVGRKPGMFSWTILVPSARDEAGGYELGEMTVHLRQVWWESVKAALMACLVRSYFTDYVLPFVLAGVAIVAGVGLADI